MPATLSAIGIQSAAETTVDSLEYEKKTEVKVITDSTSGHLSSSAINPTISFRVSGRGSLPAAAAIGGTDADISDIDGTGVTIVNRVKYSEVNDDFQKWEYSGENFPGAS